MKHTRKIIDLVAAVLIRLCRHVGLGRFTTPEAGGTASQADQLQQAAAHVASQLDELVANGRLSPTAAAQLRMLLTDPNLPARVRAAWLLPTRHGQLPAASRLCEVLAANSPAPIGEQSRCQTNTDAGADAVGGDDDTLLLVSPLAGKASVTSQMIERANAGI